MSSQFSKTSHAINQRERYHSDPAYRKRMMDQSRAWQNKNRKHINERRKLAYSKLSMKQKEKRRVRQARWCANNHEKILARSRRYHKRKMQDPETAKRERLRKNQSDRRRKIEVFTHYSNGIPKCVCCGETIIEFLALDHINNDGAKDKAKGLTGTNIYRYVRKRNYPKGFQVLCHNCNQAKGITRDHICPHKRKQV